MLDPRVAFPIQPRSLAEVEAHPPCPIDGCGAPIRRRPNEKRAKWLKRQTCCRAHGNILQGIRERATKEARSAAAEFVHSPCNDCGKPVDRRDGETLSGWRLRKNCSASCRQAQIVKNNKKTYSERAKVERQYERPAEAAPRYGHNACSRRPRRAPPGATFETVEQAIARGVAIARTELPQAPPIGVPVRSSTRTGWRM